MFFFPYARRGREVALVLGVVLLVVANGVCIILLVIASG